MKFHREGRISLALALLVSVALILLAHYGFREYPIVLVLASAVSLFLIVVILQFFRSPNRSITFDDQGIIAPADGTVVVDEEVIDTEYFNGPVRQISIFMSPINVHINWYPISGEVVYSKYHPGKYLVAWDPKSSTDNERHSVVIRHPQHGDVLVKQIAGALARRIVNYARVGAQVEQGEEMGFIKFGSRVDLLIPKEAKVAVALKSASTGRQTLVASLSK